MNATRPRAYILMLVMALLAAIGVGGMIAFDRVAAARVDEPAIDRRNALLWLARSAAATGRSATLTSDAGPVIVRVEQRGSARRVTATAADGAIATIEVQGPEWLERYTQPDSDVVR